MGNTVFVTEIATQGAYVRQAASNLVEVFEPAANLLIGRLGGLQNSAVNTTNPSFNVDTSALSAGDILYFAHQKNEQATSCTVNGNAANLIASVGDQFRGNYCNVGEYVLQAGDIGAAIPVAFTLGLSQNDHYFICYAVSSAGQRTGLATDNHFQTASGTALEVDQTVSNAANAIILFGNCRETFAGGPVTAVSYTGVVADIFSAPVFSATEENVATGAYTVEAACTTSDIQSAAAVSILIEPV